MVTPLRSKVAQVCAALNDQDARYVLVGAQAMIVWGGGRNTRDIDLLIEATPKNAQRVLDGLEAMGFILVRDLDAADVARRPVTMIGDLYRVDLMTIAWAIRYPEASREAHTFTVDSVAVPTASIRHLIASKRTGRPQDAADIEVLEEIARQKGQPL